MPRKKIQLPYKPDDYSYRVNWHEPDRCFLGRVEEFPSLSGIGDSLEEALQEIKTVVRAVLEDMAAAGEEIPEPYSRRSFSGKLNLRMPEELHRKLALEAARQGVSLNQLINLKLAS
jgi:predicted HicB family RNase H-like nuclease